MTYIQSLFVAGLPAYASFLYTAYPDKVEQQLIFALIQMIWDRGEGNGYAQHMTSDPYPNTPAHQVLWRWRSATTR